MSGDKKWQEFFINSEQGFDHITKFVSDSGPDYIQVIEKAAYTSALEMIAKLEELLKSTVSIHHNYCYYIRCEPNCPVGIKKQALEQIEKWRENEYT